MKKQFSWIMLFISLSSAILVSCSQQNISPLLNRQSPGLPYITDFRVDGNAIPGSTFDLVLDYQQGPEWGETTVAGFFSNTPPMPDTFIIKNGDTKVTKYLNANEKYQVRLSLCIAQTGTWQINPSVGVILKNGETQITDFKTYGLIIDENSFRFFDSANDSINSINTNSALSKGTATVSLDLLTPTIPLIDNNNNLSLCQ
jgi:hypothetical protein